MKSLKEIVTQLRSCGYTCEAGPLENNADFKLLEEIAGISKPTMRENYDGIYKSLIDNPIYGKLAVRTPQEIRDEIIEQAKRDVADLTERMASHYPRNEGNRIFRAYRIVPKFYVNKDKRVVTVLINFALGTDRTVLEKGIAKCDPSDCFNVHIGKAIALRRALGLEVSAEYLSAPQPTEVRVGDVVNGNQKDGFYKTFKRFTLTDKNGEDDGFCYAECPDDWIEYDQIGAIIDDSREEVAE